MISTISIEITIIPKDEEEFHELQRIIPQSGKKIDTTSLGFASDEAYITGYSATSGIAVLDSPLADKEVIYEDYLNQ